jgi:hypothetical protein
MSHSEQKMDRHQSQRDVGPSKWHGSFVAKGKAANLRIQRPKQRLDRSRLVDWSQRGEGGISSLILCVRAKQRLTRKQLWSYQKSRVKIVSTQNRKQSHNPRVSHKSRKKTTAPTIH